MIRNILSKMDGIELLKKRFKDWAIKVVLFTRNFPDNSEFRACRNQLVRSAPSAAANYRAACRSKSDKDFLNKLKIVEEELDESIFWIEFALELDPKLSDEGIPLLIEGDELLRFTVSSIGTTRNKIRNKKMNNN